MIYKVFETLLIYYYIACNARLSNYQYETNLTKSLLSSLPFPTLISTCTFSHGPKNNAGMYNDGKKDMMKQDGQMQGQGGHPQGGRGNRGGWVNRGNMRGRGGRGRGGFRANQTGNVAKPKTLKFDNDYDFEQANTQFEELR